MSDDQCQCSVIHQEKLDHVAQKDPGSWVLTRTSELFRLMGDPTRLGILQALSVEELCVCDLATFLGMSSSAVSHQLRLLRDARLVKFRRDGKVIYYSLLDHHVDSVLKEGLEHGKELKEMEE